MRACQAGFPLAMPRGLTVDPDACKADWVADLQKNPAVKRQLDTETVYGQWAQFAKANHDLCLSVLLKGKITNGDYETFRRILVDNPSTIFLYLWSPGGDLSEAMKIGQLVRDKLIQTEAPYSSAGSYRMDSFGAADRVCSGEDCICASSCFVVWAGGIERQGTALGLHRPAFDDQYFSALSPKQAQNEYAQMVDRSRQYLAKMEILPRFIDIMFGTSKDKLHVYGDDPNFDPFADPDSSLRDYPASIREWIGASCELLSLNEHRELYRLIRAKSRDGKNRLDYLWQKQNNGIYCATWVLRIAHGRG